MSILNFSKIVPTKEMRGDGEQDGALLRRALEEAIAYICSFDWCGGVTESYFGLGVGGVVAVFLFKIVPKRSDVDEWLWVVVGDLPPAYLVTDDNPTPVLALEAYIAEMSDWVTAVEMGQPVDDIIPVNVPATPDNARQLRERLKFLREEVIPLYTS